VEIKTNETDRKNETISGPLCSAFGTPLLLAIRRMIVPLLLNKPNVVRDRLAERTKSARTKDIDQERVRRDESSITWINWASNRCLQTVRSDFHPSESKNPGDRFEGT